ncbi:MMPL family transporter [Parvibaculum sp.]|uniref:MMPL family transporter n=1 Tax=Parvibaculum sp. TaxID=2024848 RepID=UPI003BAC423F
MQPVYRAIVRWPTATLLVVALATLFFGWHARNVRLDASVETLLNEGDDEKAYYDEIRRLFGSDEIGVVGVLADDVYQPDVLKKIQALTEAIAKVDGVAEVVSLSNAVDPVADVLDPPPLIAELPRTPEESQALRAKLAERPIYLKNLVAPDGRAAGLNVFFEEMSSDEFERRGVDDAVAAIVAQANGPETVVYTGLPHFKQHSAHAMRADLRRFVPLALGIVVVILALCFRSFRGVLLPVLTILVTLIWTLGLMVLLGTPLSLGTLALPPLLLVLASAYCLHVVAEYYETAESGGTPRDVVLRLLQMTGTPIVITAITTVIGFLSLVTNQIVSIRQLGIYSSIGVVIAILLSLIVVPSVLALLPLPKVKHEGSSTTVARRLSAIASFGIEHRRALIIGAAVLCLLSATQIPHIQVDTNLHSFFRAGDPIREATDLINERLVGSMAFYVAIDADQPGTMKKLDTLERIRALQREIDGLHGVDKTISFVDYAEMLDRGSQAPAGADEGDFVVDDAGNLVPAGGGSAEADAAGGKPRTFWENPAQLEPVIQLVASSPKSFQRVIDKDFSRTHVLVRTTLARSSEVTALVDQISEIAARVFPPELRARPTGNLILMTRTASDLVSGQISSLALATIVIFAVMALMFLSVRVGLIAMIPNFVPVIVFFGLMGLTGAPLNLGTSIIASIVLGIVVDDTIHLMSRLSAEIRATADQHEAMLRTFSSVGKPALYNSALLFFGFASLATSTFVPLQQFGVLSAVTILVAILTELALFPALLATTRIITLWDLLGVKLGQDPHRTIPLFAELRPSQARLVALLAGLESHTTGERVVRQGEVGDQMYVIINGKAEVVVDAGGERRSVRELGRGDVFGEMGLIRSHERTADVVAKGPLEVMTVDQRALTRVQRRYPRTAAQIFLNLARILSDRLQTETARRGA